MKPLEFIGALLLFCRIYHASAAVAYYGKLIGKLDALHHGVSGDVYAVDARTLYIRGFTFDGQGPDAVFFGGSSAKPGPNGFVIPNEKGLTSSLGKYDNQHLTLTLPEGKTFKELRWIAVWSRTYSVVLGEVNIAVGFDYPRPQKLGVLAGEHQVSSDRIFVVDAQTFLIPNFTYDGSAPDAFFWVGRGLAPNKDGVRVPDENGGLEPLKRYDAKTLVLTLPGDLTVFDIDWISIWCKAFYVDFGNVKLPKGLNVPPSLKMLGVTPQAKLNCEVLWDDLALEIRWAVAGETIVLQLVGKLDSKQYIAFGPSGDPLRSLMDGADVAVAYLDKTTGKGQVTDYIMNSKGLCSGTQGVCPDVNLRGGANNVRLLNAALINDYVMLTYQRPLKASDEHDRPLLTNTSQPIVWAVGKINSQGLPAYHSLRTRGDMFIDFGRMPQWNCPAPEETAVAAEEVGSNGNAVVAVTPSAPRAVDKSAIAVKPWSIPPIECYEPENRLYYVHIGPTGGDRGYNAITGHVGWGIAWYINGLLIPEINVVRGQAYTFVVEGGDNPDRSARYHPFYITDDPEGGYAHKTPTERSNVRVFAGVTYDREGNPAPAGTGRLCEWVEDPAHPAQALKSFGAFQRTLKLNCEEGQPGIVQWTPDENTPDTVFYQCYTHRFLGWKINVVDSCDVKAKNEITRDTVSQPPATTTTTSTTTTTTAQPTKDGIGLREFLDYEYDDDFQESNGPEQVIGSSQNIPVHAKHPSPHFKPDEFQDVKHYREPTLNHPNPSFDSFPTFPKLPSSFTELYEGKPFFGETTVRGPSSRPQYSNIERDKVPFVQRPTLDTPSVRPPPSQNPNSFVQDHPQEPPRANYPIQNPNRPSRPVYEPAPPRVNQNHQAEQPRPQSRPERPVYQDNPTKPPSTATPLFQLYASSTPTSIIISNERPVVSTTSVYRPDYYTTPYSTTTPERKTTNYPPRQIYQASELKSNVANFNPTAIIMESGFKPIKSADGPIPPLGFEVEAEAAPSQTFQTFNTNNNNNIKPPSFQNSVTPTPNHFVNLDPMFFPSQTDPDEQHNHQGQQSQAYYPQQGLPHGFEFRNASIGPNDPIPIQIPVAVVPVVPQGILPKQPQRPPSPQPPQPSQSNRQPEQVQPPQRLNYNQDFNSQRLDFNPNFSYNDQQQNIPPSPQQQRNPPPPHLQQQQRPSSPPQPIRKPTSAPFFRLPAFFNQLRRQQIPPPTPPQSEFTSNGFAPNQPQRRPGPNPQLGNNRPLNSGRFPSSAQPQSSANPNPFLNRLDGGRKPIFRYAPRDTQRAPVPGNRPLDRIDQQGEASAQTANLPPQLPPFPSNRPPRPSPSQLASNQGNAQSRPPVPNFSTRPTPTLTALQQRPQFGSFQGELPPPVPENVPTNLPQFQQQQPPRSQRPNVRLPPNSAKPLLALSGTRTTISKDERKELEEYLFGPMRRSDDSMAEESGSQPLQPGLVFSHYPSVGFEAGSTPQNSTDLVILKDVWSNMKVGGDKIAKREGLPDAEDFHIVDRSERKLSLTKRETSSNEVEIDSSKLPLEHRGDDEDHDHEDQDHDHDHDHHVGSYATSIPITSSVLLIASSVLLFWHC